LVEIVLLPKDFQSPCQSRQSNNRLLLLTKYLSSNFIMLNRVHLQHHARNFCTSIPGGKLPA
jgi:hypothetical protein